MCEFGGPVRLSPVAAAPRLTVAAAPRLTVAVAPRLTVAPRLIVAPTPLSSRVKSGSAQHELGPNRYVGLSALHIRHAPSSLLRPPASSIYGQVFWGLTNSNISSLRPPTTNPSDVFIHTAQSSLIYIYGTGYEDSINRLTIPLTEQFNLKGRTVDDSRLYRRRLSTPHLTATSGDPDIFRDRFQLFLKLNVDFDFIAFFRIQVLGLQVKLFYGSLLSLDTSIIFCRRVSLRL
ncbi:unnamed protein product [Brassica napus]|uniref:(rape) hypothetical protein n=1 Tax=Brassica napus TaxID=3708 RepID=A0A816KWR9_BRANA|nr:unnamed protein product [Brassica napus]